MMNVKHSFSKNFVFTEEKVENFAYLCEDHAPVHFDKNYAIKMGYKNKIVHGFFISSIFSGILGNHLPGKNSVIRTINLNFMNPVFIKDEIIFKVEVDKIIESVKNIQLLLTAIRKSDEKIIIKGNASCILKNE